MCVMYRDVVFLFHRKYVWQSYYLLGGVFIFFFLGKTIPIDYFFWKGFKPPTSRCFFCFPVFQQQIHDVIFWCFAISRSSLLIIAYRQSEDHYKMVHHRKCFLFILHMIHFTNFTPETWFSCHMHASFCKIWPPFGGKWSWIPHNRTTAFCWKGHINSINCFVVWLTCLQPPSPLGKTSIPSQLTTFIPLVGKEPPTTKGLYFLKESPK